jgi:hypothetical protein
MPCVFHRAVVVAIVLLACIGVASFDPLHPASATSLKHHTIQLSGSSVRAQHTNLSSVLSPLLGVRVVDLDSVPDRTRVDVESGILSYQDLIEVGDRLRGIERGLGRADPVRYHCRSTRPLRSVASRPYHHDSQARV